MNRTKVSVIIAISAAALVIGGRVADAATGDRITHSIVRAVSPTLAPKVATIPSKHAAAFSPTPLATTPIPAPLTTPTVTPGKSGMASKIIITPEQKAYDSKFGVKRDANGYIIPDSGLETVVNRRLILSSYEITVPSGKLSDILTATTEDGGSIGYLVSLMSSTNVQADIKPLVDALLTVPSEQFRIEADYWHEGTTQIKLMATAPYDAGKPRAIYTALLTVHVVAQLPTPSPSSTPTP